MTRGTVSTPAACAVVFGSSSTGPARNGGLQTVLGVSLPLLAGPADELLLANAEAPRTVGEFILFEAPGRRAGFAVAPEGRELEAATRELYAGLFAATRGLHLYRIWNYVPLINAQNRNLENYRLFCRGRSLAFEQRFGPGFKKLLPAASAVGTASGPLALGFLAGETAPLHFENPRQVPAFEYPPQYGPRSPSFARATSVAGDGGRQIFISGTAAITGHQTMAAGDCDGQLTLAFENLQTIAATAGAGPNLCAGSTHRAFKVYLRRATDLAPVQRRLQRELLQPGDTIQILQADVCRADLLVEIEAVLTDR